VPGLYADRLRPGGRIDTWYLASDPVVHQGNQSRLTLRDLGDYRLTVGERAYYVDIRQIISDLRDELSFDSQWLTAITQGDPTEPNIAWPRCWLDFQYATRNSLAGEIANLLWYLLARRLASPPRPARRLRAHYLPRPSPRRGPHDHLPARRPP
jgi:hypothetical protein